MSKFYCNARIGNTCITVCFNQCSPCKEAIALRDLKAAIERQIIHSIKEAQKAKTRFAIDTIGHNKKK